MFDIENFKVPVSVRITPRKRYRVVWIEAFKDPKQLGECDSAARQIVLLKNLTKLEAFWTFLHEVMHAISFESGLNLTEKQVDGTENGFARVAKLNKWT